MSISSLGNKWQWIFLSLILLLGFSVRLYKFTGPVADWHSWRQADTSAVSRNFVQQGFDILYPRFDDLSNVPSGLYDNPNGYRFVEFPIFNILQAGGYMVFNHFTIEEWGRLVSIFGSLGAIVFLFLIGKRYASVQVGLFAAFFYAFLPFSIFYSRTILPDQLMTMTTLGGIYFFSKLLDISFKKNPFIYCVLFVLTSIFISSSLLLKPFSAFFFLPLLVLVWEKWGKKLVLQWELYAMGIITLVPLIAWRIWISHHPEGIPASGWLFNEGNIRFTGAYFHWIFARRIGELILGYWGLIILGIGLLVKPKKYIFFYSFLASSLIYVIVVARGNVQHSYYQIPIIPTLCLFLALGSSFLLNPPKEYIGKIKSWVVLGVSLLFMFSFSWFAVRDYYNINNPAIITAGKAVDALTPKNAKIVAPYDGDTTLLYLSNRQGWASFEKSLPELIKMGASYLVLVNPKPQDYNIGKTYKIVSATPDYILFDLHKKP